jgi:hypothetical protein
VWTGGVVGLALIAATVAAVARQTVFDLYPEDHTRSVTRFAEGAQEIEVDPRQPWARIPRILPGPADAWAGGTAHALAFPLGSRPARGFVLYLFLGDTRLLTPPAALVRREAVAPQGRSGELTRLTVAVNRAAVTTVEVPSDTESRSPDSHGVVLTRHKVEIPATALGHGSDVRLSLINQSGMAVVFDRMRLVEARPTFAWANLGRRGRFPPESAAFLGASFAILVLWNLGGAPAASWARRALRASGPAGALILLGLAELMPLGSLTVEIPRWPWLGLSWILLLFFRPRRRRQPDPPGVRAERSRVEARRIRARRIASLVVYPVGVWLFFEGVSRTVLSTEALVVRLENYDEEAWWRLRWIERRSRELTIYYSFDEYHPARGWALKPNVRDLVSFAEGAASSNSMGVRGRREYAEIKPAGVTRILVFGDSLTFGDEVSDDQTYSSYLEGMLPDTEVLNLGVHGYGHDQMLLYLEEVGAGYQPDIVLLGFVSLDMERNLLGFRDFAKPRFDLEGDRLVLRNSRVPTPEDVLVHEHYRSRFIDLVTLLYEELRSPSKRNREDMMERLTAAILDQFRRTVGQLGATPVFAYLPVEGEISWPETSLTPGEDFFVGYCRDRKVLAIDLRPYFLSQLGHGARFKSSGHWSRYEHQAAAEGIAAYLLEKKIVPDSRPTLSEGRLERAVRVQARST